MNWNIRDALDSETHRAPTIACLFALLAIAGLAVALSGGAAAAEPVNETVEVTNDTGSVYAEVTFASGIDDANAAAEVVVTDANGSEFATETITGNASESVVAEWTVNDSDPTGDYSVVVTADSGVVDLGEAGTFAEGVNGGGGSGGDDDGSVLGSLPMWVVVIVGLGVIVYGYTEGWFEDL